MKYFHDKGLTDKILSYVIIPIFFNNRSHSLIHAAGKKKKKVDTVEGVLTLVLLSRGVDSGVACNLEGE